MISYFVQCKHLQFIHTMDNEASIFVQWFEIERLSNMLYVLFRKKRL